MKKKIFLKKIFDSGFFIQMGKQKPKFTKNKKYDDNVLVIALSRHVYAGLQNKQRINTHSYIAIINDYGKVLEVRKHGSSSVNNSKLQMGFLRKEQYTIANVQKIINAVLMK